MAEIKAEFVLSFSLNFINLKLFVINMEGLLVFKSYFGIACWWLLKIFRFLRVYHPCHLFCVAVSRKSVYGIFC